MESPRCKHVFSYESPRKYKQGKLTPPHTHTHTSRSNIRYTDFFLHNYGTHKFYKNHDPLGILYVRVWWQECDCVGYVVWWVCEVYIGCVMCGVFNCSLPETLACFCNTTGDILQPWTSQVVKTSRPDPLWLKSVNMHCSNLGHNTDAWYPWIVDNKIFETAISVPTLSIKNKQTNKQTKTKSKQTTTTTTTTSNLCVCPRFTHN